MAKPQLLNYLAAANPTNVRPPSPEDIAELAIASGVQSFLNQFNDHYISFPSNTSIPYVETLPLKSNNTQQRLLELVRKKYGPNIKVKRSDLKAAASELELPALQSPTQSLHCRFASEGHELYFDLADKDHRVVEINPRGWRVQHQSRPKFVRKAHMQEIQIPTKGGSVETLFQFVPQLSEDERLLLLAWLLSALDPRVPSPILMVVGPQGSAKTTMCRRIRNLIDRSSVPVLGDYDMRQAVQALQSHAIPCFENVSSFNRATADLFCRAVTGNGIERRKLFTDGESVLFSFQCPNIVNGLALPSTRPDFLDRCIIIQSKRLEKFLPIADLEEQFKAACPEILGAILDLLVTTLGVLPTTPSAHEFRMADFARFGRAVATVLGATPERFDAAYRNNRQVLNAEIVDDQMLALLVQELASAYQTNDPWIGTASELSKALFGIAKLKHIRASTTSLPRSPRGISSALSELIEPLKAFGVLITQLPRESHRRPWSISQMPRERGTLPSQLLGKEGPE